MKSDARGVGYQYPRLRLNCPYRHSGNDLHFVGRRQVRPTQSQEQLAELRATLRKPKIADLIKPYKAGRLVNQIRRLAEDIGPLPRVKRSPDSCDDYLLAMSEAGRATHLVTGDKSGLLSLRRHKATQIVSASSFAALFAAD